VKTVTIQELHRETDRLVQAAETEDVLVVENGRPRVVLKKASEQPEFETFWQQRERQLASIATVNEDSTAYVSEDRDGR
jgi:prevent-host-death family protein